MLGQYYNQSANSQTKQIFGTQPLGYADILRKQGELYNRTQQPPTFNPVTKMISGAPKTYQTYSENQQPPSLPKLDYLAITRNNNVGQDVLNQLGGIEDTIKPM